MSPPAPNRSSEDDPGRLRRVDSAGGPWLFAPADAAATWRGVGGPHERPAAGGFGPDYTRACEPHPDFLNRFPVGGRGGVPARDGVLWGDEAFPLAALPDGRPGFLLPGFLLPVWEPDAATGDAALARLAAGVRADGADGAEPLETLAGEFTPGPWVVFESAGTVAQAEAADALLRFTLPAGTSGCRVWRLDDEAAEVRGYLVLFGD